MSTWKSDSTGSTGSTRSKASTLFGLEEDNDGYILVYRYRSGSNALEVSTQRDLCRELDNDPDLPFKRVTKKPIPRTNSRLEIRAQDLLLPSDLESHRNLPNASVANVGLTRFQQCRNWMFNSFPELYIVSRGLKGRPDGSEKGSLESSLVVGEGEGEGERAREGERREEGR